METRNQDVKMEDVEGKIELNLKPMSISEIAKKDIKMFVS